MLNLTKHFSFEQMPNVTLYEDDRDPTRFYAVPNAPRVTLNQQSAPQINLLLYGSGDGSNLQIMGGQLTMSCSLALEPAEENMLLKLLLAQQPHPSDPGKKTVPPDLGPIQWVDGSARVHLIDNLESSGTPSLTGSNQYSLSLTLDAAQAKALQASWDDGLPDATITYSMHVLTTRTLQTQVANSTDIGVKSTVQNTHSSTTSKVDVTQTQTVPAPLILSGPVALSAAQLSQQVQMVKLG